MTEQLTPLQQELSECLLFNELEGPCVRMAQENEKLRGILTKIITNGLTSVWSLDDIIVAATDTLEALDA